VALAAPQLFFMAAGLEVNTPATRAGIALAGAIGVDHHGVQIVFSRDKGDQRRLATETGTVAMELRGFQAGPSMRMPRTRLTATTKYTAPKMGHQRGPARSIQAVRCSHFSVRTAGL